MPDLHGRILPLFVAAAACRTPHARAPEPLGAGLDAWVPADAVMVIAIGEPGEGEAERIDAIAAALGVPRPGAFVAVPDAVAAAWREAGVRAEGVAWIMLDDEAMARCARVDDAARAGAVRVDEMEIVARDGIACVITGGARSVREHHAVRLLTLGPEERLPADTFVPVAGSAFLAWGDARMIGIGIHEDVGGRLPEQPIAVGVDLDDTTLVVTTTLTADADPYPIGTIAGPPGDIAPPDATPSYEELAPEVPYSDEWTAAHARYEAARADALALERRIADSLAAAARAWTDAWGTATIAGGVARWRIDGDPVALRPAADAARDAALAPIPALLDELAAQLSVVQQQIDELVRLRAKDVAAWDRSH